jgi:DNA polymerase III sliding clamp (beta) subunit (PCNA family)
VSLNVTRVGTLYVSTGFAHSQSQSINKVPTRFDVYIKGNRNDFFATRGADIAILTGFGEHLFTKVHGFISNN